MHKGLDALRIALAATLMVAAILASGALAFMSANAGELPIGIPEGENEPVCALEGFFARLKAGDLEGADRYVAGGSLGLGWAPEDENAALLWQAQRESWEFAIGEGYAAQGAALTRQVTVSGLDFSAAAPAIHARVQAMLAQDTEDAVFAADVLTEDGGYVPELVMAHLRTALEELAESPEDFRRSWTLTVPLTFADGAWKLVPDQALIQALTGGAVRETGSAEALCAGYEMFVNNLVSASLEGLAVVPKVYWLPEDTVVAPAPGAENFGVSKNPADTAEVIGRSAALLEGKHLIWSPDTETMSGRDIRWYADETIFAVCWKQSINRLGFNFCEIVIGHPSQFRRYIADDSFRTVRRYLPTQMADTVNAVVALSGDFIKYRQLGICVYRRELCRADGETLDTCFVNSGGELLFVHRGELVTEADIQRYIEDNDVLFSLCFGPIMIENGENVLPDDPYPIGQPGDNFTRCVLCQIEEGHYLLATVNVSNAKNVTLRNVTAALLTLGVPKAYALDGGQTASLIIGGRLFNSVDFNEERTMSDIIYFATALPEAE